MKCPECGGVGRIHYGEEWCSACNGTGEVQTNEEWLHTMNTVQLAEFLIASIKKCKSCASGIGVDEVQHCPFGECGCHFKDEVIKWLKQPHTTIKE